MTVRVIACVIEREGRLLICQRPAHKRHGGLWEFPGGKLEPGESEAEAVRRELEEELGLGLVEVGPAEFVRPDPGSPFVIEFMPVRASGEPEAREHDALAWVAPEHLLEYPLAPSDEEYARFLTGRG